MSRDILTQFEKAGLGIASGTYEIVGFPRCRFSSQIRRPRPSPWTPSKGVEQPETTIDGSDRSGILMIFRIRCTIAGAGVLAFTFQQVFRDLFHPTAHGSLSHYIARGLWRSMKRKRSLFAAAGPIAFVTVVFSWALLVCLGFALIYWPALPGDFKFSGGPERGFLVAAYYSVSALTTLGAPDIAPMHSGSD